MTQALLDNAIKMRYRYEGYLTTMIESMKRKEPVSRDSIADVMQSIIDADKGILKLQDKMREEEMAKSKRLWFEKLSSYEKDEYLSKINL